MAAKIKTTPSVIEWGVATRPAPGQTVSGDTHLVAALENGVLLAVVDGLGRGSQAAIAAETAVTILKKYARDSIDSLVQHCHRGLMMTRGAVMTLVSIDGHNGGASWLGVGNVEGLLLRARRATIPAVERLTPHGGVVGYQMPKLRSRKISLEKDDLLVLTTDGVEGDFTPDLQRDEPVQKMAEQVLARHFKGNDDALVLVARYVGMP
jgi:negative regulator of sigma-B (phosphoserine phosphatase)